jgi:DNA-binding phage protein
VQTANFLAGLSTIERIYGVSCNCLALVESLTVTRYWHYDAGMTALMGDWPEPDDTETVAQRLRMYMGDKKMSRVKLALASGMKRSTLANKLDSHSEFTISEILAIAHAIDRSWMWVLTGQEPGPEPGSRLGESNPRPIHYKTLARQSSSQAPFELLRQAS